MRRNLYASMVVIGVLLFSVVLYVPTHRGEQKTGEKSKPKAEASEKFMVSPKEHPFGNIYNGPLMWESTEKFLKVQKSIKAYIRMGAFETILPDPLPGEEFNVARAADLLTGTIVKPGEAFSLCKKIGPFTVNRGYKKGPTYAGNKIIQSTGGGVCKIASNLYNVTVNSNLPVITRYPHSMLVPYVPPGQDATISYEGCKDFRFTNNTDTPLLIWADTKDATLYVAIYGSKKPPKVKWGHQELNRVKHDTIYRVNPNLSSGQERVIIPGSDGIVVKSWVEIEQEDGSLITKQLGIDKYKPMTRVIERSK